MRIETLSPIPPPRVISMSFEAREGWVIVAALRLYAEVHQGAQNAAQWEDWAAVLDAELRSA